MTNREKEDRENERLKNPTVSHSSEISKLIDKALKEKRPVWCFSDPHFWIKDKKDKSKTNKRPNFDKIIKEYKDHVKSEDLVIFLGDLVDGEFTDKDRIKDVMLCLPGQKILVRGNNDLFDDSFYKSCGFDYVVRSFIWNDIIFTHIPVVNDNYMNIHGHLHFDYKTSKSKATYWVPYTNQVCVFNIDRVPILLHEVIRSQTEFCKHITVNWDKVNESRKIKNIFEMAMDMDNCDITTIVDPCDD